MRAESIQTGREHSMAAGWNSSSCRHRAPPRRLCPPLCSAPFLPGMHSDCFDARRQSGEFCVSSRVGRWRSSMACRSPMARVKCCVTVQVKSTHIVEKPFEPLKCCLPGFDFFLLTPQAEPEGVNAARRLNVKRYARLFQPD